MLPNNHIFINFVMFPLYKFTWNTVNVRAQTLFDLNNISETKFKISTDVTAET